MIKKDSEYKSLDSFYAYYKLYYSEKEYIKIFPNGNIQFINDLKPGEYTCFKLEAIYQNTGKLANINTVYCRFEIEEGKYTLFPYVFKTYFKKNTKGVKLQYFKLDEINEDILDSIKKELAEIPKYSEWEEKIR
ncbi:MAG: hypothetical protein KKB59_18680 [Spirochaetes bacterium]|nr:hypothetical protein [Spirochaetota bacterium]